MRASTFTLAAGAAMLLAAGPGLAGPGRNASMGAANPKSTSAPATTAAPQGSTHGQGWNHMNGPSHTGQPNQECGSASAPTTPGNAASAPGSAFNPNGKAGTVYAGEQPQNSRNTASVSQYDVACAHQPR